MKDVRPQPRVGSDVCEDRGDVPFVTDAREKPGAGAGARICEEAHDCGVIADYSDIDARSEALNEVSERRFPRRPA